ncbi:hypothetical protein REC12_08575 [Desulfosporosinus sp. PR]|uniref:hypothetical protein n=1 Tax=Candidatus Desulfosporosinus nitrosoreducens TaxID=3401928 RepID=UPI0027E9DFB2|nr:hypothetical protein [Desulfosporosinus sp. PR]MDQ7093642.1 hypothetical protein [Desulfosporosinus sp. PR]
MEKAADKKSSVHFWHFAFSDKPVAFYNLKAIIFVGYRVKSVSARARRGDVFLFC